MDRVTMQALKLDAAAGWRWVAGGWRLFRKQPFGFVATLFLFWLVLLFAAIVIGFVAQTLGALLPVSADALETFGSLLFAVVTPALTVGFLQVCRSADAGLPVHPVLLFAPFRAGRTIVRRLLLLGLVQAIALAAIAVVTPQSPRPDGGAARGTATSPAPTPGPGPSATTSQTAPETRPSVATSPSPTPGAEARPDGDEVRARATAITLEAFAYLPVALLMWYSPMLIAWHDVPVGKSLFFNVVGMWRNRGAFVLYFIAWAAVWTTASLLVALIAVATGTSNLTAALVAPVAIVLLTCMYCSMYQTYATVYVETRAEDTPAVAADVR